MFDEKVSKPHTYNTRGVFTCLAVGKNNVTVVTTHQGFKACGHCITTLRDVHGEKIPFTLRDLLDLREATDGKAVR